MNMECYNIVEEMLTKLKWNVETETLIATGRILHLHMRYLIEAEMVERYQTRKEHGEDGGNEAHPGVPMSCGKQGICIAVSDCCQKYWYGGGKFCEVVHGKSDVGSFVTHGGFKKQGGQDSSTISLYL